MHAARAARSVSDVNGRAGLVLDDWFARDLVGLYEPWQAAALPAPRLLALNDDVAAGSHVAGRAPGSVPTQSTIGVPLAARAGAGCTGSLPSGIATNAGRCFTPSQSQ